MKLTVIQEYENPLYGPKDFSNITQFEEIDFLENKEKEINESITNEIDINTTHLLLDDVIILSGKSLKKLKKLVYIGTTYTGWWDKYFDIHEIKKRKIKLVINTGYATNAVAEATFAAILQYARLGIDNLHNKDFELMNKKLLILGNGRIGKRIKEISDGFKIDSAFLDTRNGSLNKTDIDLLSINLPKSAGKVLNYNILKKLNKLKIIVNSSGWENVNNQDLKNYLNANVDCIYLHLAFPDKEMEKYFSGVPNMRFYPLFSNKTVESKLERKEAPIRELIASIKTDI